MKKILLIAIGQSNWQGAAKTEGGGAVAKYHSAVAGLTDPLPMCNNSGQGGSCFPKLIDIMACRGIRLDVYNAAFGGASIWDYCGRVGATVPVPGATIIAQGWLGSGQNITGGTPTCIEGDSGFDPLGLLARVRAAVVGASQFGYDAIISYWVNGESDAGASAATYAAAQVSVANYMVASGVTKHIIGLTSKQATASGANFQLLQQGIAQAVATCQGEGKPVASGHDMYAHYGSAPPLYPESNGTTYVHMTLRGQEQQAWLVNNTLYQLGF